MLSRGIINKVVVIFFQGLALLTLPLISKYIGSEQYGIWSIVYGMMQMLVPIFVLQLDSAFTRFISGESSFNKRKNIFFSIILFLLLPLGVLSISFYCLDSYISQLMFASVEFVKFVYIVLGWVSVRVLSSFSRNYFRTIGKFRVDTVFAVLQQIVLIGSVIFIVFGKGEIYFLFTLILLAETVLLILLIILILKDLSLDNIKIRIPKKYFIYAIPLIPTMILSWVINYSDQLMIVHYSSLEENARYALYYTYSRIPHWIIVTPLNYALLPFLSKFKYDGESVAVVNDYVKESINVSFILISILMVGLVFYASEILYILSNEKVNMESVNLVLIIALSVFATAFYQIVFHILSLKNETGQLIFIFGFGAIVNLVLNIYLIPYYGIIGAALSTLVSFFAVGVLTARASNITLKDLFYRKTLVFILLVITSCYLVKIMVFTNLFILATVSVVLVIVYSWFIYRFFHSYYLVVVNNIQRIMKA
jgi:O-antigen/teichoic acid export membrane protein